MSTFPDTDVQVIMIDDPMIIIAPACGFQSRTESRDLNVNNESVLTFSELKVFLYQKFIHLFSKDTQKMVWM